MKAKIKKVTFLKEKDTRYGIMYDFKVDYNDTSALYCTKNKEQTKFIKGQEAEFTEETRKTDNGATYTVIKPPYVDNSSNFGRQLKREQSKYSGFAVSYVKDLILSGKVSIADWKVMSRDICLFMKELDEEMEK